MSLTSVTNYRRAAFIAIVIGLIGADAFACTIAVIDGRVTVDGRPLLWKNRDVSDINQKFSYFPPQPGSLGFIANHYVADSTRVFMGINEAGFGIMNSNSYNLDDSLNTGIDDGTLMWLALRQCSKLADFEALLDSTNTIGRSACWNFGALDATGRAAIYECGNRHWLAYYAEQSPNGILVRSNHSFSGNGNRPGLWRLKRATYLLRQPPKEGGFSSGFILRNLCRDLANEYDDPNPLPYNRSQLGAPNCYIFAGTTINNTGTASAAVIRGVRRNEDPAFSAIFAILGPPVLSLSFPLWVGSHSVPIYLNADTLAPMVFWVRQQLPLLYNDPRYSGFMDSRYLLDTTGGGIYAVTLPLEQWATAQADSLQSAWQESGPNAVDISTAQWRIARYLFNGYLHGLPAWVRSASR